MIQKPKKAALTFIFITVLVDVIGLGIIIPVIPSLIVELTGEGLSEAAIYGGWLMFVYAFTQFVFAPVIGGLSDRFGRRPVLLFSLLGFGIDYLLIGFAPNIFWLFVARLISGITGASHTTASAYIADVSEPEKRAQNFGLIGAAFGLGFIIGPVVGGLLGQYGARVPFFAAAGLTLLNVLYGYFILPESLPPEKRRPFDIKRANPLGALKHLRKFPGIGGLVIIFGLIYLSGHATQSTWTYFTMLQFGWDEAMVGISLGVVGVSVFVVQGGLTRIIIPKIGEVKSVYFGLVMYFLGFLGFAFAPSGLILMLMIAPFCLGGLATPSIQGIISNKVPDDQQGELQGALTSLISFTAIFGPPLMTGLFGYFTSDVAPIELPGAAFVMGSLLIIISLILAVKFLKRSHNSAVKKPLKAATN
ncbi:MAG: TCR/Tet family MFS transporter [Balneola sp.]|jgi:DHA1 family tetracycline resistance protein-like MFS transporter